MSEDKKNKLDELKSEIERLKGLIEKDQEAIKKINELLRKADQRYKEEIENQERWLNIIENLENSLIETRRIHQGRVIYLQQLQKEYQEALLSISTSGNESLPEIPLTKEEQELLKDREIKDEKLASVILETTAEKWGEISLGELSQIIISMKSTEGGEKEEGIAQKSEEELEKTIRSEPIYLQLRNLLVSGLNKVWSNKPEELTSQEKMMIFTVYKHLEMKKNKNTKEERLFRVISAVVRIMYQKNRPI